MDRSAGKNKEPHGIVEDIYAILLLQEFDMGVVKNSGAASTPHSLTKKGIH